MEGLSAGLLSEEEVTLTQSGFVTLLPLLSLGTSSGWFSACVDRPGAPEHRRSESAAVRDLLRTVACPRSDVVVGAVPLNLAKTLWIRVERERERERERESSWTFSNVVL